MSEPDEASYRDRWARLRFSIVGPLLAAPPAQGEMAAELMRLSQKSWRHPITGTPMRFGVSTIERWYYAARGERRDPVKALRRRIRKDAGLQRRVSEKLRLMVRAQYQAHRSWSYQLHRDNLAVVVAEDGSVGPMPSYSTLRRYMKGQGLFKQRRHGPARPTPGAEQAANRLERLEVRSFEAEYVHGLWHLDFHHGSRKVTTRQGAWSIPVLLGVLDDRSRLACHRRSRSALCLDP